MFKQKYLSWFCIAAFGFVAVGCGDAENNIVERDPIVVEDDHDHDHDHEHESEGRLVVLNSSMPEAAVYNTEDGSLADSFVLDEIPSAVHASGGYRYAVLVNRAGDLVEFLDGGMWQEDHVDHLHDYEEAPAMLSYSLSDSRPTHVVNHDGQLAIFFDGDSATMQPASVTVITDNDITGENATPATLLYPENMHGVAEPRGEYLLATVRDDSDTTSANPILPDHVGVYHLHDGEYEQEEIVADTCPNLHGAAQNEEYVAFGCSDGVLLLHDHGDEFESEKILNSADIADGLRVGSLYGHEEAAQFIGLASAHGGASVQFFSIDPEEGEMDLIDWEPVADAQVVARGFAYEAEQFLILDSQGYLTLLEPHYEGGHTHWEFAGRVDITEEDVSTMPADSNFMLAIAQNGHTAYVADPIAQHIIVVDLDERDIVGDIELDFLPAGMAWVGIVEAHDH